MLSGHSATHLWKFTGGFIGPQILNFERSLNLLRDPKAVLFRIAKFLLEALVLYKLCDRDKERTITRTVLNRCSIRKM